MWRAGAEQCGEKLAVVITRGAHLPHVCQQLRQLPAAQLLHSQDELHSLKVCQVVAGKQGLL